MNPESILTTIKPKLTPTGHRIGQSTTLLQVGSFAGKCSIVRANGWMQERHTKSWLTDIHARLHGTPEDGSGEQPTVHRRNTTKFAPSNSL
jgi:hypothetical protein